RTGLEGPGLTVAQKLWYCIATVGGQYIWARLQSFSAFRRDHWHGVYGSSYKE
ncbi:peroxisome biogenesis protein 2-like, partial [Trifolium medium]|nr:peroxisome biogenesis protein 2-like [Trifolium medium]